MANKQYNAQDFGDAEKEMIDLFNLQLEDSKSYFFGVIKPRLDRSYKLYMAYIGDRQKEIKSWQANVFVPYVMAAVETLMPRILDARPEFTAHGRTADDQLKAEKQQQLMDYFWEISNMDSTSEDLARSSLIYGTGFLQVSWKKDVRTHKFLETKDLLNKKLVYKEKTKVFYDAPFCEWTDNYSLLYDWHNTAAKSKQFWIKRLILTEAEIKRKYPGYDKKRLEMAINGGGGDLTDWAAVRNEVKSTHESTVKGAHNIFGSGSNKYEEYGALKSTMYEVFEWTRPFDDVYAVLVGGQRVPILKKGSMPIPYDFKEAPFIAVPYLKLPNEFEGVGLPMILENPQVMLNLVKNQRLDSATLSIHKMWIVNPLANINKEELVTRPFGIIYSIDPNGVREVEFSDIKQSAYREEDLLKQDMRYSSGVDDFSMGAGGTAGSATEVRHLRESTLERVRLFVNHLGDAYSEVMRYWMDMQRQFFTKKMYIRLLGENGKVEFPLIEKDDLMGEFDYRASVLPSIAGQQDVRKKQDMDLFQLLINLPFIDPKKLTSKVLVPFGWSVDSVLAEEQPVAEGEMSPEMAGMAPGGEMSTEMAGMAPGGEMTPDMAAMMGGQVQPAEGQPMTNNTDIPPDVLINALKMMGRGSAPAASVSHFKEASSPIDLLSAGNPPTAQNVRVSSAGGGKGGGGYKPGGKTTNIRGLNRNGKVNSNVDVNGNSNPEASILRSVNNIQR